MSTMMMILFWSDQYDDGYDNNCLIYLELD